MGKLRVLRMIFLESGVYAMSSPTYEFEHPPVSELQRLNLEYLIGKSRDAKLLAKQVAIWLVRHSRELSKPCCVYIPVEHDDLAVETAHGFHDMVSGGGTTFLDQVMGAMNTMMRISCHGGDVLRDDFEKGGYTFWVTLRAEPYSRTATELEFDLAAIQAIEFEN